VARDTRRTAAGRAAGSDADSTLGSKLPLDEMQQRVASGNLQTGPEDRELTERKQRQIVDRASKVLFEKGFGKTSIRDIAAAADMSMGQLYHYISSKDDILYLMHRRDQEMWYQHLADAGFDDIEDPVQKLEYGLRITFKYLSGNRDFVKFIFTESKYLDREHLEQVMELDNQNVVGFYRHLLQGVPGLTHEGREAEFAANIVHFIATFLPLRGWNLHLSGPADVDAAVEFLVDFIFRGLGIERAASAATERSTTDKEA
jgi:AcrR family transcriptional regulator